MPHKQVLFESEAREKVLKGATTLANAVRVTLGPQSKRVLVEKKWGTPLVCDDGVTIAKEMELEDPVENLGVRTIRQAAERTGEAVGDGTTTSTLLAHAIYAEGVRNVVAGASAIQIKRGLERALSVAVAAIKAVSRPVQSRKEKAQVATISAHGDEKMGELVADAFQRVGDEGVISVEEAKTTETTLEVVEGMQFDNGYLSPYFVTDPDRMECVLEDPVILIHQQKIGVLKDFVPFLEQVVKTGRPLLVIAEDVEGEALATMVVNKLRGTFGCAAVKAPGFGDRRKAMLEDIAVLTGGKTIAAELGTRLERLGLEDCGRAKRVVIDKDSTTIIGGQGEKNAIRGRCERIRREIKDTTSDYDREKLEERLAKLSGGVAVIHAGAASEAEMKSVKEAFEDAISSTKAAIAEGIVPGAGLVLLRAAATVEKEEGKVEGDEKAGFRILRRAFEVPTRQIARNSGLDDGVVVERMRSSQGNVGLDAARGTYVDLVDAGIVDATKVVRLAVENAVSVAGILLLTEATMTEVPEKKPEPRAAPEPEY
ncbi:MAG TPA: chaperonin GroEL [Polyangiaceae bacterium]|nr:chaperonin GroEL [Polyangiaceae bacterium]